jgi:hypothetical protein
VPGKDKGVRARGRALLAVAGGEPDPVFCDAGDVRRAVVHQSVAAATQVEGIGRVFSRTEEVRRSNPITSTQKGPCNWRWGGPLLLAHNSGPAR